MLMNGWLWELTKPIRENQALLLKLLCVARLFSAHRLHNKLATKAKHCTCNSA